ncbi:MAG: hypothetical protein IPG50_04060 [Myxococcales bacterium]|nr:hypothetical protein [Myxococcales bacterium]
MIHRLYFSPGMFGFGRLGAYDYFEHLERAIAARLRAAGHEAVSYVVDVPPTASLRRRATVLAELVARTAEDDGPIHLVGHSTGGLDARLVASPSALLPCAPGALAWLSRLKTVTTLNTPHCGTPLASFFATLSGQRMLYAMSALTIMALTASAPPMAAASALVVAIGSADRALGLELRALDRATDALLRVLDDAPRKEIKNFLDAIRGDQGSVIQLTPEAMDLFQVGVEDRAFVHYQSVVTMAPAPSALGALRSISGAWSVASTALFAALWRISARTHEQYPCTAPLNEAQRFALGRAFGSVPEPGQSDGVVPTRSQVWGEVAWAGHGDHLDVLGHFRGGKKGGARGDAAAVPHRDWLCSGAGFNRERFDAMVEAVTARMSG